MYKNKHIQSVALLAVIIALGGQAMAHSGAMGIVKERMDAMALMGDHAKTVGNMLKGKTTFEISEVEAAAQAFVLHGEQIPMLFPDTKASREGSNTEALPTLWENWADFTALVNKFNQDSQTLLTITNELSADAKSADEQSRAIRGAFFRVAKSCSGCHERFRADQG